MAFAPFPAAAYLSDGARTEGEMKTAFENWLLATKQTSGHGGCRLLRTSATLLALVPHEGRRVLVNDRAYEVPGSGVSVTNAGLLANRAYYAVLVDTAGVVTLELYDAGSPSIIRVVDPDTGVNMLSGDGGTTISRVTTVVGMVNTNASSQFTEAGTCSLHGRLLKVHEVVLTGDVSGGSATNAPLVGMTLAAFDRDAVVCHGHMIFQAHVSTQGYVQVNGRADAALTANYALLNVAANLYATVALSWSGVTTTDQGLYVELGYMVHAGAPISVKAGSRLYVTRWA